MDSGRVRLRYDMVRIRVRCESRRRRRELSHLFSVGVESLSRVHIEVKKCELEVDWVCRGKFGERRTNVP